MAVPPGVIDEIRDRADLLGIIGEYVSLRKAGRNWIGLCPFHSEKTPSFSVSPEKNLFYCFGCGAGGDIFGFLKRIENLTFMEAIERLAARVGVEIPRKPPTPEEQSRQEDRERIAALIEETAVFFHRMLTKEAAGEEGRNYLIKRAIDIEMSKNYRLGWAPREWDGLHTFLNSRGYSGKDQEKAGVAVQRDTGGYYDRFRGRIMFPIISVQGRVLGFGGRLVADEEGPKYMNSPESVLYQKSRVLYGLNAAQKAIRERDSAIIVEGYFDALSLVKHGFENTVAPCGTALTVEQVSILNRYTKNLYPLFDADEAGDKARMRALEVILKAGAHAKSAVLPKWKDPDEFLVKEGTEAMRKVLDDAVPLLDAAAERIFAENGPSVDGRRKSLAAIAELLAQMVDRQARELYMQKFAPRLGGTGMSAEELLRREVASITNPAPSARRNTGSGAPSSAQVRKDMPECYLLALLLAHPELEQSFKKEKSVIADMDDVELAKLARRILEDGSPDNPSKYLDNVDSEYVSILSKLIIEDPENTSDSGRLEQIFTDTVLRVRLLKIRRLKEEIQSRLAGAKPEEMAELMQQKKDLLDREKKLRQLGNTEDLQALL